MLSQNRPRRGRAITRYEQTWGIPPCLWPYNFPL